jgi:hypothetical protein
MWRTVAERNEAAADSAATLHAAGLEHQAGAMEKEFLVGLKQVEGEKEKIVEVYRDRVVEVYEDQSTRPWAKFSAERSVHQWRASWMAGAASPPAGTGGKNGRPQWYSSMVFAWEQFCLEACRDAGVPEASPGTNLPRATPIIPVYRPAC